jgi:LuxR family quorum-sensing transcriptional regulator LasR
MELMLTKGDVLRYSQIHYMGNEMTDQPIDELSPRAITLSEQILTIINHQTELELTQSLTGITKLLQFDYYQYVGSFAIDQQKVIRRTLSTFPEAWNETYEAQGYEQFDPIVQHTQTHLTPLIWGQLHNLPPEQQHVIDDAHLYGIGDGVTFAIQARNGDIGTLSFANTVQRGDTDRLISRSLPEGNLVATYLHDAMRRIVHKERYALQAPLSGRELECLYWIRMHKSNWEIARILGISEHGVVYYVRKLLVKFGVHNRHQAVARATAYGLL